MVISWNYFLNVIFSQKLAGFMIIDVFFLCTFMTYINVTIVAIPPG